MTSDDFCKWLGGVLDVVGNSVNEEILTSIKEKLKTVTYTAGPAIMPYPWTTPYGGGVPSTILNRDSTGSAPYYSDCTISIQGT